MSATVLDMPHRTIALDANGLPQGHYVAKRACVDQFMEMLNALPDSWYHMGREDADDILSTLLIAYVQKLEHQR